MVEILKAGIRFLGLAPKTLADIYTDIATIAGVVGASERGQAVIANMQREIETVEDGSVSGKKRLRVFCEEWGKPVIVSQRWVAELVDAAGGEFLGDPGAHSSAESVLAHGSRGGRGRLVRSRRSCPAGKDCPRPEMATDVVRCAKGESIASATNF